MARARTPFPDNHDPDAAAINPVSAKVLALLPATNESYNIPSIANNYFGLLPFQKTNDSFDVKHRLQHVPKRTG